MKQTPLWLGVLVAGIGVAERGPLELRFLPGEPILVASFEPEGASPELFAPFRGEILRAMKLGAPFERLGAVARGASEWKRVVAAAIRWGESGRGALVIARGEFDDARLAGLRSHTVGNRKLFLSPGDSEEGSELALAKLDADTLAFGGALSVLEAIRLFDEGGQAPVGFVETAPRTAFWAAARPEWLGFAFSKDALEAADIDGRSLCRSLMEIRALSLSAEVGSEVELIMRTRARDEEDARILLDALANFVRNARSGAPAELGAVLERAEVVRSGPEVRFTIPLTSDALERLRGSRTGRNVLTWRLGEEERESRQRIGAVHQALGLGRGSKVADVGAGGGFFTVRLARAVGPTGRVYAVDVQKDLVEGLKQRAEDAGLENVEAVLGATDDPRLPEGELDAALIVNSYHEMTEHVKMLERIRAALRAGGRLVILEPYRPDRRGDSRADQVGRHEIAPELVEEELRSSGFEIVERVDDFAASEAAGRSEGLMVAARP